MYNAIAEPEWRNWQTRCLQKAVSERKCGSVTVDSSDNVAVSKVELYLDGVLYDQKRSLWGKTRAGSSPVSPTKMLEFKCES